MNNSINICSNYINITVRNSGFKPIKQRTICNLEISGKVKEFITKIL